MADFVYSFGFDWSAADQSTEAFLSRIEARAKEVQASMAANISQGNLPTNRDTAHLVSEARQGQSAVDARVAAGTINPADGERIKAALRELETSIIANAKEYGGNASAISRLANQELAARRASLTALEEGVEEQKQQLATARQAKTTSRAQAEVEQRKLAMLTAQLEALQATGAAPEALNSKQAQVTAQERITGEALRQVEVDSQNTQAALQELRTRRQKVSALSAELGLNVPATPASHTQPTPNVAAATGNEEEVGVRAEAVATVEQELAVEKAKLAAMRASLVHVEAEAAAGVQSEILEGEKLSAMQKAVAQWELAGTPTPGAAGPVPPGYRELYRGEPAGRENAPRGLHFSDNPDYAQGFAGTGGSVYSVRVPEDVAAQSAKRAQEAGDVGYTLTTEWADLAEQRVVAEQAALANDQKSVAVGAEQIAAQEAVVTELEARLLTARAGGGGGKIPPIIPPVVPPGEDPGPEPVGNKKSYEKRAEDQVKELIEQREVGILREELLLSESNLALAAEYNTIRKVRLQAEELGLQKALAESAEYNDDAASLARIKQIRKVRENLETRSSQQRALTDQEAEQLGVSPTIRRTDTETGLATNEARTLADVEATNALKLQANAELQKLRIIEAQLGVEGEALDVDTQLNEIKAQRTIREKQLAEQQLEEVAVQEKRLGLAASAPPGTPGGAKGDPTWFQRVQAGIKSRDGEEPVDPLTQQTGSQFLKSKALTTAGFAVSGALFYGAFTQITEMIDESKKLQVVLSQMKEQFDSIGDSKGFAEMSDQINRIAQDTGVATSEVAQVALQFRGAFGDTAKAAAEADSAIKLAVVSGLDIKEITDQLTATAITYDTSIGSIGDKALALQENTGVLAKETIGFVSNIAEVGKQAGLSLTQLGAIGAVAQQTSGRPGSSIAEAFGRVLPQIQEKGADLIELYQNTPSLSGAPLQGLLKNLGDGATGKIFLDLAKHFSTMSKSEQDFAVATIGGRREAQQIIGVLQNYPKVLSAMAAEQQSAGKTSEYFAATQSTAQVSLKKLEETFRQIGQALLKSGLADGLTILFGALQLVARVAGDVVSVIGKVNDVLGGLPVKVLLGLVAVRELSRAFTFLKAAGEGNALTGVGKGLTGVPARFGRYLSSAGDTAAVQGSGPIVAVGSKVKGVVTRTVAEAESDALVIAENEARAAKLSAVEGQLAIEEAKLAAMRAQVEIDGQITVAAQAELDLQAQIVEALAVKRAEIAASGAAQGGSAAGAVPIAPVAEAEGAVASGGRLAALGSGALAFGAAAAPVLGIFAGMYVVQKFFDERDRVSKEISDYTQKLAQMDQADLKKEIEKRKGDDTHLGQRKGSVISNADNAIPVLGWLDETFGFRSSDSKEDAARAALAKDRYQQAYNPILASLKQKRNKDLRDQVRNLAKQFGFDGNDKDFSEFIQKALADNTSDEAGIFKSAIDSVKPVNDVSPALANKLTSPGATAKTIVHDIITGNNKALKKKLSDFAERSGLTLSQLDDAVNSTGGFDPTDIEGKGSVDAKLRTFATNATNTKDDALLYSKLAKASGVTKQSLAQLKAVQENNTGKRIQDLDEAISAFQSGDGSAQTVIDILTARIKPLEGVVATLRKTGTDDKALKQFEEELSKDKKALNDALTFQVEGIINEETLLRSVSGQGPDLGHTLNAYKSLLNKPGQTHVQELENIKKYVAAFQAKQAQDIAAATNPEDLQKALDQKIDPAVLKRSVRLTAINAGLPNKDLREGLTKAFGEQVDPEDAIQNLSDSANITLLDASKQWLTQTKRKLQTQIKGESKKKQKRDKALLKSLKDLEPLLALIFPDLTLPDIQQSNQYDVLSQQNNFSSQLALAKGNVRDPVQRALAASDLATKNFNLAKKYRLDADGNPDDLKKYQDAELAYYQSQDDYFNAVQDEALAAYDVVSARATQRGDVVGAAKAQLDKATAAYHIAPNNTTLAGMIQAQTTLNETAQQYGLDYANAGFALATSQTKDPLKRAQIALSKATSDLNAAKASGDIIKIQNAQAGFNDALNAYYDANLDAIQALRDYQIAGANAHGDPVQAAKIALDQAKAAAARNPQDKRLAGAVLTAQRAVYDAQFSDIESDIDFDLEMGKISKSQAIQKLRAQLKLAEQLKLGKKTIQDLQLKIKQIQDGANQDATFDVPANVELPTLYEARRLQSAGSFDRYDLRASGGVPAVGDPLAPNPANLVSALSANTSGAPASIGYQDNRTQSITLQVSKDVDVDGVIDKVTQAINAPPRLGTVAKVY